MSRIYLIVALLLISDEALARGSSEGGGIVLAGIALALLFALHRVLVRFLGENLTFSIGIGTVFSFLLGIIPFLFLGIVSIFVKIRDPSAFGYVAMAWWLVCISFAVYQNQNAIKDESNANKKQSLNNKTPKGLYGSRSQYEAQLRKMGIGEDQIREALKGY